MARPRDVTALGPTEARWLQDFLRSGKAQYGLDWADVAFEARCDEKSIRNRLSPGRVIPRRVAKELIDAMRFSAKAQAWRKKYCCRGHESGDSLCSRVNETGKVNPCDPWVDKLAGVAMLLFLDRPVSAVICPTSIDEFSTRLGRKICADLEISSLKCEAITNAVRSFLNLNGERFAQQFSNDAMLEIAGRVQSATIHDKKLRTVPKDVLADFAGKTILAAVRAYWPGAMTKFQGPTIGALLKPESERVK